MKKFTVCAVICFFLALPTISFGAGMYGSFNGGVAQPADGDMSISGVGSAELEYDTTYTVAGAIGYRFGDFGDFRVEGEVAYQNNEVDRVESNSLPVDLGDEVILSSMEASILSFLFNGYIDFYYGSALSLFVTAGGGVAVIDGEMTVDGVTNDGDDTVFAYQLGAGAGYAVTETVTLDCKYRYFRTEELNIEGGDVEVASPSHSITLGIRVAF
jgi:opacity protein-like surface antigen